MTTVDRLMNESPLPPHEGDLVLMVAPAHGPE